MQQAIPYFVASCHILVEVVTRYQQTLMIDASEAEIFSKSVVEPDVALGRLLTVMLVSVQAK